MTKRLGLLVLVVITLLAGCSAQTGDYTAASAISRNGFARDANAIRRLAGQEVKLWGYVDHSNLYGDESAKQILGDWWRGECPDAAIWRFNLKAEADDAAGHSFAVQVPNDPGRNALLAAFVADASAQKPTRIFLTGRLLTFDAPTNAAGLTGLTMELESAQAILLALPRQRRNDQGYCRQSGAASLQHRRHRADLCVNHVTTRLTSAGSAWHRPAIAQRG
jgi:hypothetical protein